MSINSEGRLDISQQIKPEYWHTLTAPVYIQQMLCVMWCEVISVAFMGTLVFSPFVSSLVIPDTALHSVEDKHSSRSDTWGSCHKYWDSWVLKVWSNIDIANKFFGQAVNNKKSVEAVSSSPFSKSNKSHHSTSIFPRYTLPDIVISEVIILNNDRHQHQKTISKKKKN